MAKGIERFSAPPPGEDFDATDEAQFRRLIEQFMENADYRVRDVGDDVESLDDRITALEGETVVFVPEAWDGLSFTLAFDDTGPKTTDHTLSATATNDVYMVDVILTLNRQNQLDVDVQVDADGTGGFSTVDSFVWIDLSVTGAEIVPVSFVIQGQSMESGGKIRLQGEQTGSSGGTDMEVAPIQVRGV